MSDVTRPAHYGGDANPFEPIKIIEHYQLGFHLGNTIKYVLRSDKKGAELDDLRKAHWYLGRRIEQLQREQDALGPPFDVTMDIVRADGATETRTIRGMRTRGETTAVGHVPKGDRIGALQVTGRTTFADAAARTGVVTSERIDRAVETLRKNAAPTVQDPETGLPAYRYWGDSSGGAWNREPVAKDRDERHDAIRYALGSLFPEQPVVANVLDPKTAQRVEDLLARGEQLDRTVNRLHETRDRDAEDVVNELRVHGVIHPERYVRRAEEVVAAGGYDAERVARHNAAMAALDEQPDEPWSSPLINQEYRWGLGQTIAAATTTPAFAKLDGQPEPKVQLSRHPRAPYKADPAPRHQYLHGIGEDARRRHHEARLGVFTQLNPDGSVTATHITSGTGMTIVDKKASIERRRARAIKELLAHLKDRTDIMSQPLDTGTGMEHAP